VALLLFGCIAEQPSEKGEKGRKSTSLKFVSNGFWTEYISIHMEGKKRVFAIDELATEYATLKFDKKGNLTISNLTWTKWYIEFKETCDSTVNYTFTTDGYIEVYVDGKLIAKGKNLVKFTTDAGRHFVRILLSKIIWEGTTPDLYIVDFHKNVTIEDANKVLVKADNVGEVIVVWKNYTYIFNKTGIYQIAHGQS
jgi:hypothetical protein